MKKLAIILMALATLFTLSACAAKPIVDGKPDGSDKPAADIGEWTVTVVTASGEVEFTSADAKKLGAVTIEATKTNKNSESITSEYTGVKLSDVLTHVGVSNFTGLTVEASDSFAADYDREIALSDDTILAWAVDGKLTDGENPLQMAPKNGTGNQFVKQVAKIIIND